MKRLFFLSTWIFITLLSGAQPVDLSKYSSPIKVACVGNSITYGHGIVDRENDSYPAQLGKMLGDGWEVRNFGVSGRTLLKKGNFPYWNEEAFEQSKAFLPDIVIIKLGTNDTKPVNWEYSDEFLSDYRALVKEYQSLSSHPKVYLCKPVPAYGIRWDINDTLIVNGVIPMVEQLAKEENLPLIDLYSALEGKPEFFPDLIHPNEEGARLMAKVIYQIMAGKEVEAMQEIKP